MTSTKFDNLWILMSKYIFKMDSDTIHEDLTCVICKKIMIDSYQSECGCQYCQKCIREYLNNGNQYCPGMKYECKEECLSFDGNVLRNAMLNKKVSKLKVCCPNESCELIDELIKMEGHLLFCMKEEIKCPYAVLGCDNKSEDRDKIMSHLNEDTFKHNDLIIKYIQNIKIEFTDLKESSNDIDNMKMEIISLENELKITKLDIISLKEESIVKENKFNDYFEQTNLEIAFLKEESIVKENEIKALRKEVLDLSDVCMSLKEASIVKENKCNDYFEETNLEIAYFKEKSIVIENEIKALKKDVLGFERRIKSLKEESKVIEIQNNQESDIAESGNEGNDWLKNIFLKEMYDFVWIIKDFSEKVKSKKCYFCELFYINDYKLCVSITLKDVNYRSCLQLYAYILRGETNFNDIISKIKVNIVNQWNLDCNNEDEYIFSNPVNPANQNYICLKSISLYTIYNTPGFICEDSIIIGFSLL